MRIEKLILSNFRSYKGRIEVNFGDMNVFVGRNDIGKSTVLEALDIFFNEGKGAIKIDKEDVNKSSASTGNSEITIGVVFSELPNSLTIDATNETTLQAEHLLNRDGRLEIHKKFPNGGKEKIYIVAHHPTNAACSDLLLKKQADLKKLLTSEMTCIDERKNSEIRKAIWNHHADDLSLQDVEIEASKEDAKNIWEQIKVQLPLYALFQSDRKNSDGDNEIQDPMKLAVQEILKDGDLIERLNTVASDVQTKLDEVAVKTLEKLKEMNPEIANSLNPVIPKPASLKWADVFKSVSITGDDEIPINKRGSGVKRLVLLNFFRAEAERRRGQADIPDIIYAIEEPETSQHQSHQRKLIDAFIELSNSDKTQILMTSHSPSIVKMLKFEHLRLIREGDDKEVINVDANELPYPSLNEVNYLAFGEADAEYHNELYGFIEGEGWINDYKQGKSEVSYIRLNSDGSTRTQSVIKTQYIRHMIHHPENTHNTLYTNEQLQQSIRDMRQYIQRKIA